MGCGGGVVVCGGGVVVCGGGVVGCVCVRERERKQEMLRERGREGETESGVKLMNFQCKTVSVGLSGGSQTHEGKEQSRRVYNVSHIYSPTH